MNDYVSYFLKGAAKTTGGLIALTVSYTMYVLFTSSVEKFSKKKIDKANKFFDEFDVELNVEPNVGPNVESDVTKDKVVVEKGDVCIVDKHANKIYGNLF